MLRPQQFTSFSPVIYQALGSLVLFLSFIFGDTHYFPYLALLLGVLYIVTLFFYRHSLFSSSPHSSSIFLHIIWFLFLVGTAISMTVSHYLPLSIERTFSLIGGYVFFSTTMLVLQHRKEVYKNLLIMTFGIVLVVIVIATFQLLYAYTHSSLFAIFPERSFVLATLGHSRVAGLLVMVLPVSLVLTALYTEKKWWFFCLSLFVTTLIVLTMGRLAITLALCIWLSCFFIFSKTWWKKNTRYFFLVIALMIVATVCFFLYIAPSIWQVCPSWIFSQHRCQSVLRESRPYYWLQAVDAVHDYPWLGYGPGTFSLVSEKYRQFPGVYTQSAHNELLELSTDSGVVVALFFLLLIVVMVRNIHIYTSTIKEKNTKYLTRGWLIGIYVLLCFFFLDFVWRYIGVLYVFLYISAFFITSHQNSKNPHNRVIHLLSKMFVLLQFFLALTLVLYGTMFIVTEKFMSKQLYQRAFDLFPFFVSHQVSFIHNKKTLFAEQQEQLRNTHNFYTERFLLLNDLKDPHTLTQLRKLNIWKYLDMYSLKQASSLLGPPHAYEDAILRVQAYELAEEYGFFIGLSQKSQIAGDIVWSAQSLMTNNMPTQSAKLLLLANEMQPGLLSTAQPIVPHRAISEKQELEYWLTVRHIPVEKLGENREAYAQSLLYFLGNHTASALDIADIELLTIYLVDLYPWGVFDHWRDVSQAKQEQLNAIEMIDAKSVQKYYEILQSWHAFYQVLAQDIPDLGGSDLEQLARAYVQVGNKSIPHELSISGTSYQKAVTIAPWVLSKEPQWFEIYGFNLPDLEVLSLADGMRRTTHQQINYKHMEYSMLYHWASNIALVNNDYDAVAIYINNMYFAYPTDYYVASQLGNLYLMGGLFQNAQIAYEDCLFFYTKGHPVCEEGLKKVGQREQTYELFFQNKQYLDENLQELKSNYQ